MCSLTVIYIIITNNNFQYWDKQINNNRRIETNIRLIIND